MDTRAIQEYWTAYSPSHRVKVGASHSNLIAHYLLSEVSPRID